MRHALGKVRTRCAQLTNDSRVAELSSRKDWVVAPVVGGVDLRTLCHECTDNRQVAVLTGLSSEPR